jgi:hypothetical protein
MENNEKEWVNDIIVKLENVTNGVVNLQIGGVPITAEISEGLLKFFKENRAFLLMLGKEAFSDFLYLIHEGKEEEAFILLAQNMGPNEIIAKINNDADEMKRINDNHDKFIADLIAFGKNVILPTLAKAIIGLLI